MSLLKEYVCVACLDVKPYWLCNTTDIADTYNRFDCKLGNTLNKYDKPNVCHCNYDEEWESNWNETGDGQLCNCGIKYDQEKCQCCQICRFITTFRAYPSDYSIMETMPSKMDEYPMCVKCADPVLFRYERFFHEEKTYVMHFDVSMSNLHEIIQLKTQSFMEPKSVDQLEPPSVASISI
jgi:hypothetical protein